MFNKLLVSGILLLVSNSAMAGTIKEGAVICISQKYLEKYEKLISFNGGDFINDMLDRAQCVIKKKDVEAFKVGSSGDHIRVESANGFKVWLNSQYYTEGSKNLTKESKNNNSKN